MKIYHILIILLIIFGQRTSAQNQNNNWYFGNRAAVTFVGNNPIPSTNNLSVINEGCATVSDPTTGNLLFYTNGLQIWDSNNNIMLNGNGLLSGASTSATQGVLIVPYPSNSNLYYVFTVDETNNNGANGFRYSVVDISLNNGLGDVITTQKNILIQSNTTERIAVTKNANGTGYWIVIHERNNNCFKAYSLTSSGLNTNPVISNIGSIHSSIPQANGDGTMGYMKFSPDGSRIAVAIYAANQIELFDFDDCSGLLSNSTSVSTLDNPYGVEFSPDNSKLYYSLYYNAGFNGAVYQLNLSSTNLSPQLVGISSSINNQCMGALQLAPDNKIYIAINGESWLSAITQPNNIGVACGFVDQAIILPNIGLFPTTGILGLPPKVLDKITNTQTNAFQIEATNLCLSDSINFEIIGSQNFTNITWDFGVTNISTDTSTNVKPKYLFSNLGTYTITAIINFNCQADTIFKTVEIINCDTNKTECIIKIPNVFTPNGDVTNDQFYASIECEIKTIEMNIYNRWGNLVWYSNNINSKWDGKYLGKDCTDGVYFYIFNLITITDEKKRFTGSITLLR
jgi:gliding motility-associated-like protein